MIARSLYYLYQLRRNLRLKPAALQEMQQKKLRAMIKHAYENVPFYHMKFNQAGIGPDDVRSIDDLAKVPFTTKAEIQACPIEDIVARNVNLGKCVKRMTSGSTGIPLAIYLNRKVLNFETALLYRAYLEDGLRLRDRMVRITEPSNLLKRRTWLQRLGILRTEYVSIFDDVEKQFSLIESYNPEAIRGYASCVALLADFCKETRKDIDPRLIFTGAELLDKKARQLVNSVFQTELFDLYVSMEFGVMAWECLEHTGHHINAESLLLEIVKNGVVGTDELGEIVCTSLTNDVMPLIRYKIGDVGAILDEQCTCGVSLPLLKIIEGRTGDFLVTSSGRVVAPTVFFPYPFEDVAWIRQFRIIQESKEKIVFEIVLRDGYDGDEHILAHAAGKVRQLFGEDIEVVFKVVKKLQADPSGKLRKVISRVPTHMAMS